MDVMRMMAIGAMALAEFGRVHTAKHAAAGFSRAEWDLMIKPEPWTAAERRRVRAILAEAVNVTLELAGLPSEPLPGQYVAAVLATLVAPCNRLVAAHRVPETYDAESASGLKGPSEVLPMTSQQMVSLVMAYSAGEFSDIPGWKLEIEDEVVRRDKDL